MAAAEALAAAAARLNNTREVCRKSYVTPRVPESYVAGILHEVTRAEAQDRLRHSEAVVLIVAGAGDSAPRAPRPG